MRFVFVYVTIHHGSKIRSRRIYKWPMEKILKALIVAFFALLIVGTHALADPAVVDPGDSLVAYWPADGDFNDVVGGNNGTPHGGVCFVPGDIGLAFDFDGKTGRVAIPDSPSLALTQSLAITAWIDINAYPTAAAFILFRGDDRPGLDPYKFFVNPEGTLGLSISDAGNNEAHVVSPSPLPVGVWTYVSASLDNSTGVMSVYINGILAATSTTTVRPFGPLDPAQSPGLGIGNVQSGNYTDYFDGIIDEVKLYDSAQPAAVPPFVDSPR